MSKRVGSPAALFGVVAASFLLVLGGLAPSVAAQTPDRSDVVLEFDYSASILRDVANRNRFAGAIDAIAARVDETAAALVAGDTTVSLIQFASRAADYPGCVDLVLLNSPQNVTRFSGCLRSLAQAYRRGPSKPLTKRIGVDTNYVSAMQQAAKHLPADAERPAVILFTDGKHDVKGVPASRIVPVRDQLFGNKTSFALLPVGMGLDPKERGALTAGLDRLKIVKNMPACASGSTFDWPTVSFNSPAEAGNAVAVALQDATCTFTVAPTPTPPTPPPAPTAAPAQGIQVVPGDSKIDVTVVAAGRGRRPGHRLPGPLQAGRRRPGRVDRGRLDPAAHDRRGPGERHLVHLRGRDRQRRRDRAVGRRDDRCDAHRQATRPAAARRPGPRTAPSRSRSRARTRRASTASSTSARTTTGRPGRSRSTRRRSSRRPSSTASRTGPSIAAGPTQRTTSA